MRKGIALRGRLVGVVAGAGLFMLVPGFQVAASAAAPATFQAAQTATPLSTVLQDGVAPQVTFKAKWNRVAQQVDKHNTAIGR